MNATKNLEDRFWSKVDRRGPDDCWLWTASKRGGYGQFYIGKHSDETQWIEDSHRTAFFLAHGRWPEPCCLHNCPGGDNPLCCNPSHLREGTQAENIADMVAKERQARGKKIAARGDRHVSRTHPKRLARGEKVKGSKLKEWKIPHIRTLLASGVSRIAVARAYGVSPPTIDKIALGTNWAHIP